MERRRTRDRREAGPTPHFPITDCEGSMVCRDRRETATRRLSDFQSDFPLDILARCVPTRHGR